MGTPIVGNAHDALDDAKTLAFLAYEMWNAESFVLEVKNCR